MTLQTPRLRVIEEHQKLRGMLDHLDELTKRFSADEEVGDELREAGASLFEVLAAHLALEDSVLVPALVDSVEGGAQLADRLQREHTEQREMLRFLVRRLEEENRPTALIWNELKSFSGYLRRDMRHEEETILREGLLPD